MNISLNLLPEHRKVTLEKRKRFWIVVRHEAYVTFVFLFLIATLSSIHLILSIELRTFDGVRAFQEAQKDFQELRHYEEKFQETNTMTSYLVRIQKNTVVWSPTFAALSAVPSEGIALMALTTTHNAVQLRGTAKTRDDLLAFQKQMEESACFEHISVPLSDLVTKTDITFTADAFITDACLRPSSSTL